MRCWFGKAKGNLRYHTRVSYLEDPEGEAAGELGAALLAAEDLAARVEAQRHAELVRVAKQLNGGVHAHVADDRDAHVQARDRKLLGRARLDVGDYSAGE